MFLQKGSDIKVGLSEEKDMSKRLFLWLRLLLGGTLLFGTSAGGCLSEVIRDASKDLEDLADDIDDDQNDDFGDLGDWLDDVF